MTKLRIERGEFVDYGALNNPQHGNFSIRVVQTRFGEEVRAVMEAETICR